MSLIAGNLGIIQRLLDAINVSWGIYGGAAAHIYGNRRPIRNIDIVVPVGALNTVSQAMKEAKRVVQFDGRRIMWSGINLCDDLSVRRNGSTHTIKMDDQMIAHLRRMPLLGSRVALLAPEDVIVHKLLLERGQEQEQKDTDDAASVTQRQLATLDLAYLAERLRLCNATDILKPKLNELGIEV
jgi:hypothetical protein